MGAFAQRERTADNFRVRRPLRRRQGDCGSGEVRSRRRQLDGEGSAGLPDATVAWAAPLENKAGKNAVVYQTQWTNPRPNEEIKGIDIRYDPKVGNQYGTPALLAITAGTAAK